jgi:hypothetical protein
MNNNGCLIRDCRQQGKATQSGLCLVHYQQIVVKHQPTGPVPCKAARCSFYGTSGTAG